MDDKQTFIVGLYAPARKVSAESGAAWETILAQAAQETGWGQHLLPGTNNIFNIKADANWRGARKTFNVWEIEAGHKVWREQEFRVYASVEDALRDRIEFLRTNPRYAKAGLFDQQVLGSLQEEAEALQRAGYATDPHYADNLRVLFEGPTMQRALKLARGKDARVVPNRESAGASAISREGGGRSERDHECARLQQLLTRLGYRDAQGHRLQPDGRWGVHTEETVKAFQRAHGLPEVGHVGPRTRAALRRSEHGPSPLDPAHPDHALHQQLAAGLDALGARLGARTPLQRARLEAALLPLAREHGLQRVDHVLLGRDEATVFLVQGRVDDPAHRRAQVALQTAYAAPIARSRQRLEQADFQCLQALAMAAPEPLANDPLRAAPAGPMPDPQPAMR